MIKKFKLPIAVLLLSALVSCKKDEKSVVSGDVMTFTGRIGGGAKTEINGFEMTWSDGDSIVINEKGFSSTLTSDRKTATFTGTVTPANEYEAYYPASLYKDGKYVLPEKQTDHPDSLNLLSNINPMYAHSTTTDLQFYNICALMKLVVKGEGTVKTITVSADQPLSGEFEIEPNAEGGCYAKLTSTSKDAATLTLDCEGGVKLNEKDSTIFYIAIPQGEYKNLVFTLTSRSGVTWSSSPVTRNLKAGEMQVRELVGVSVVKPETLPGRFSVADGKQVQFSRGNLQAAYNGFDCDWGFAEEQWDCVGDAAGNTTIDDQTAGSVVDLFCWTKAGMHGDGIKQYGINTSTTPSHYGLGKNDACCDWGETIDGNGTWRTLTGGYFGEWNYLLDTRIVHGGTGEGKSYQRATINKDAMGGVYGMILYPDDYALEAKISYTSVEWATAESAGCVFLPAAGYRYSTWVYDVGSAAGYWSSSCYNSDSDYAYRMDFTNDSSVYPTIINYRYYGFSVRLVREVE